ncbi:MAG: hypothetical protein ABII88_07725 [Candidatus Omnitrophota bacterium]
MCLAKKFFSKLEEYPTDKAAYQRNIHNTLKVAKYLNNINNFDVSEIRVLLDQLLQIWQMVWAEKDIEETLLIP